MERKKLGLWMLLALVVGNMIGSGVFMLPASLAKIGSVTLISWVITAVGAISIALVFGRLSEALPKAGGPYAYIKEGYGNYMASQSVILYWMYVWTGNAAMAIAGIGYLSYFFPVFNIPIYGAFGAIGIIWILTLINLKEAKSVGMIQLVITIVKLMPLIAIVLLGWFHFHPSYIIQSFNVTHTSTLAAASLGLNFTLWAFLGMESATVPGDVENPKRNIPLATVIGTSFVALFYLIVSVVMMGMIPNMTLQNSSAPFALAAKMIFGPVGGTVIAIGAVIACFGALNGFIMLQGQAPLAASEDGLFPFSGFFKKKNKNGMPKNALIFSSILVSLFLLLTVSKNLSNQFDLIINLATSFGIFVYFLSALSEVILAKRSGKKLPLRAMATIFIAVIYTFWAFFSVGSQLVFFEMIVIFITFILYPFTEAGKRKL